MSHAADKINIQNEGKDRISKWDNARGILIFLVVLGHVIEPGVNSKGYLRWLFFLIYTFHMPAFFFLSGMFSKKAVQNRSYDRAASYIFLFYAMKMLGFTARMIVNGKPGRFYVYAEDGIPWYAFCMAVFLLLAIVSVNLKKSSLMAGLILLACFAGYDPAVGDTLVLSRCIVYAPFFMAGLWIDREKLLRLLSRKELRIGGAVLLFVFCGTVLYRCEDVYWLRPLITGRNPFEKLSRYAGYGGGLRLLYYVIVAVIVLCFLAAVPERKSIFSDLGQKTLPVYVFHIPLLTLLNLSGLRDRFINWGIFPTHLIPCLILTVLVLLVCSRKIPMVICRKIMQVSALTGKKP